MQQDDKTEYLLPLFHLPPKEIVHGSFSRHGGGSTAPFDSNNVSFHLGDDEQGVNRNREGIKKRLGLEFLLSAHQVHGEKIYHVEAPVHEDCEVKGYDALITDQPGVGLLIQHADCQPVMVYDPVNRVIAAIHSGWRGSVVNIAAKAVEEMKRKYGSDPENLLVAVGPSLGPCCSEFIHYKDELPESFLPFHVGNNHFDFWQITLHQLMQCGVKKEAVNIIGVCTLCSSDYFSYRRARRNGSGITGRNGTLIALSS